MPIPPRRATSDLNVIGKDAWNRSVDCIEYLLKLGVAAPLEMTDGPGGKKIGIRTGPSGPVWVKPTTNATGGGQYYGYLMEPPTVTSIVETTNLTEAKLGVVGTTQILICNMAEAGFSSHALTSGTPFSKWFLAKKGPLPSNSDPPKDVYFICNLDWEICV